MMTRSGDDEVIRLITLKVEAAGIELARSVKARANAAHLIILKKDAEIQNLENEIKALKRKNEQLLMGVKGGPAIPSLPSPIGQRKSPSLWQDTEREKEKLFAVLSSGKTGGS